MNWCPGLGTVVANEEVTADGRSDRGNFPVFKRNMRQWMMRITDYADRLIDDLDLLEWSDAIKAMQRNWIGRSHGATVSFATDAGPIEVFTTRPDTLFGATFMVLAPEHPFVEQLTSARTAQSPCASTSPRAATKDDIDRQSEGREKTGVFTGSYATNPVTGQDIPVWVADYVLMGYGTGAIMAVPCGDQRDFEFARKFGLPIPAIQEPPEHWFTDRGLEPTLDTAEWPHAFIGDAPYVNSNRDGLELDGIADIAHGKDVDHPLAGDDGHAAGPPPPTSCATGCSAASATGASRSRSSTTTTTSPTPCPTTRCRWCCPRPTASRRARSTPTTSSPTRRARSTGWTGGPTVELDLGDGPKHYRRDTNVMPQWAGSCWYELRYLDPTNENRFVDAAVEEYWMGPQGPNHPGGVDLYVGGVEHAVLHLLYARFWHKVLFDLGWLTSKEPYYRLFNQGYILAEAFLDERGIYVDAFAVERDGESFTLRGQAGHPRVGEDGQEPEERRLPRRDLRGQRRRHAAPARDGDGAARRLAPVGDPRRRRHVPLPAAAVAQRRRRGHRRGAPARHQGRRAAAAHAAPHDRRRARRHGGDALQHRDRQADRAEQRAHQARRLPARRGRAAGADDRPAGPAHRRGAVEPPRPRAVAGLRAVPHGRSGDARRRHRRVPGADQRQGPLAGHGRRRQPRPTPCRRWRWPTPRWSPRSAGKEPKKVIVVPGRMVNIVV